MPKPANLTFEQAAAVPVAALTSLQARTAIAAGADASTGRAYVNFLGDTDAARTSYGDETYAGLVSLKNEYDPTNVFRLDQNIEPEPAGS